MKNVVCAIAKNENNYINEWANYYINLGFSHIYIYDNNDSDTAYVGNFLDANIKDKTSIINKQNIHEQGLQWKVYQEFYNNYNKTFDWCLFCDIDEFLSGIDNINKFLSQEKFKNIEQIRVRWKLFGDDNIIERDINKPVFNTFKNEITNNKLSIQGKALIKGNLANIIIKSCHYAFRLDAKNKKHSLISCLPSGLPSINSTYEIKDDYSQETVFINHYMTKSLSEFINQKLSRSDAVFEDRKLDFEYFWQLNAKTKEKLNYIKYQTTIDLVVPYVDSSDINWVNLFNKYNSKNNLQADNNSERYRGQGDFFRYFFRGIEKNIPWINNIFLLVQDKSQVPNWLNTKKIKIITHDQFIPAEYLPTFNSTTIEMFLWNIPGLANHFLYANDDFYILDKISPNEFFDFKRNKIKFNLVSIPETLSPMYKAHCINNCKISGITEQLRGDHEYKPFIKDKLAKYYNKLATKLTISNFRSDKNCNCYLWLLMLYKDKLVEESTIKCGYLGKYNKNRLENNTEICINDTDAHISIYDDPQIRQYFSKLFPQQSNYELNDFPHQYKQETENLIKKQKEEKKKDERADGHSNCYLYF